MKLISMDTYFIEVTPVIWATYMLYLPRTKRNPKMNKLGGSIFIHNAIEFDYCLEASVSSLAALCDEVVLLDASSTDGTTDLCLQLCNVFQSN